MGNASKHPDNNFYFLPPFLLLSFSFSLFIPFLTSTKVWLTYLLLPSLRIGEDVNTEPANWP